MVNDVRLPSLASWLRHLSSCKGCNCTRISSARLAAAIALVGSDRKQEYLQEEHLQLSQ
jgi:hypothetical protein